MAYYKIVDWKNRLLKNLNNGILNVQEWERFIAVANENQCNSMAADMRKRLDHYAGVIG